MWSRPEKQLLLLSLIENRPCIPIYSSAVVSLCLLDFVGWAFIESCHVEFNYPMPPKQDEMDKVGVPNVFVDYLR